MSLPPDAIRGSEGVTRQPNDQLHQLAEDMKQRAMGSAERGKISTAVISFQQDNPLLTDPQTGAQYLMRGQGDHVILVLPGIAESPYGHIHNFALNIPNHRVVILDSTTFAYQLDGTGAPILSQFTHYLDQFIGSLGAQSITIHGTSLGGLLTQAYLADSGSNSHLVSKAVLVQTGALGADVFRTGFLGRAARVARRLPAQALRLAFTAVRRAADFSITQGMSDQETIVSFIRYCMRDYQRKMTHVQTEATRQLGLAFSALTEDEGAAMIVAIPDISFLRIPNVIDPVFPESRNGMQSAFPSAAVSKLNSRHGHRASWNELEVILEKIRNFLLS